MQATVCSVKTRSESCFIGEKIRTILIALLNSTERWCNFEMHKKQFPFRYLPRISLISINIHVVGVKKSWIGFTQLTTSIDLALDLILSYGCSYLHPLLSVQCTTPSFLSLGCCSFKHHQLCKPARDSLYPVLFIVKKIKLAT